MHADLVSGFIGFNATAAPRADCTVKEAETLTGEPFPEDTVNRTPKKDLVPLL